MGRTSNYWMRAADGGGGKQKRRPPRRAEALAAPVNCRRTNERTSECAAVRTPEGQERPFLARRAESEGRLAGVRWTEEGVASIPVASIQRRRPPALASTKGYWSSRSHNSSSVRKVFARFIEINSHTPGFEASRLSPREPVLLTTIFHRLPLHKEMVGHSRQVQYLLVEGGRVPGGLAPDRLNAQCIRQPHE